MVLPGAPKTIKNPVFGTEKPGFWRWKPLFFMVLGAPGKMSFLVFHLRVLGTRCGRLVSGLGS